MMKRSLPISIALLVAVFLPASASATIYDLATDWNNVLNPMSDVWSYMSNGVLGSAMTTSSLDTWTTNQPAWGNPTPSGMDFYGIPLLFESNGTEQFPHDWQAGDVITHTGNYTTDTSTIVWTSLGQGIISVTGGVWSTRDLGRDNNWTLSLDGTTLAQGVVGSGYSYSSTNPFAFSAGTTTGIGVNAGDVLELTLSKTDTSPYGDYAGVNMTVNFTPVPEPTALLLLSTGFVGLATLRRKFNK